MPHHDPAVRQGRTLHDPMQAKMDSPILSLYPRALCSEFQKKSGATKAIPMQGGYDISYDTETDI